MNPLGINLESLPICNNPCVLCIPPRWAPLSTLREQLLFLQFPSNCVFPQYDSLPHQIPFFPGSLWFPSTPMGIWQKMRWRWSGQWKLSSVIWALDWNSRLIRIQSEMWMNSTWPTWYKYSMNNGVIESQRRRNVLLFPILFSTSFPFITNIWSYLFQAHFCPCYARESVQNKLYA